MSESAKKHPHELPSADTVAPHVETYAECLEATAALYRNDAEIYESAAAKESAINIATALEAGAAALRSQPAWQAIETAPKIPDRTVLLWWTTRGASSGYYDVSDDRFGWRGDQDLCIPKDQHHCTHWMPLPAPPVGCASVPNERSE